MLNFRFFKQKSPSQRFLLILGLFMLLVYLALGIVILFFKHLLPLDIDGGPRIAFGLLLIVYSVFRFSRLIKGSDTHEE